MSTLDMLKFWSCKIFGWRQAFSTFDELYGVENFMQVDVSRMLGIGVLANYLRWLLGWTQRRPTFMSICEI